MISKFLKNFFSINGKINKKTFLWSSLFLLISIILIVSIELKIPEEDPNKDSIKVFGGFFIIGSGISLIILSIKRFRDIGKGNFWQILAVIALIFASLLANPAIGAITILIILIYLATSPTKL